MHNNASMIRILAALIFLLSGPALADCAAQNFSWGNFPTTCSGSAPVTAEGSIVEIISNKLSTAGNTWRRCSSGSWSSYNEPRQPEVCKTASAGSRTKAGATCTNCSHVVNVTAVPVKCAPFTRFIGARPDSRPASLTSSFPTVMSMLYGNGTSDINTTDDILSESDGTYFIGDAGSWETREFKLNGKDSGNSSCDTVAFTQAPASNVQTNVSADATQIGQGVSLVAGAITVAERETSATKRYRVHTHLYADFDLSPVFYGGKNSVNQYNLSANTSATILSQSSSPVSGKESSSACSGTNCGDGMRVTMISSPMAYNSLNSIPLVDQEYVVEYKARSLNGLPVSGGFIYAVAAEFNSASPVTRNGSTSPTYINSVTTGISANKPATGVVSNIGMDPINLSASDAALLTPQDPRLIRYNRKDRTLLSLLGGTLYKFDESSNAFLPWHGGATATPLSDASNNPGSLQIQSYIRVLRKRP